MNDFHWTQLLNPEFYIKFEIAGMQVGLYIVLFIIFAETGLFAGFFYRATAYFSWQESTVVTLLQTLL